jgi:hypothetical protein
MWGEGKKFYLVEVPDVEGMFNGMQSILFEQRVNVIPKRERD